MSLQVKYIRVRENRKGYTLIETITSLTIFIMVLFVVFNMAILTINAEANYKEEIKKHIYVNSIANFIEREVNRDAIDFRVEQNVLKIKRLEKNPLNNNIREIINEEKIKLKNNKELIILYNDDWEYSDGRNKIMKDLDKISFNKKGGVLYVTIELKGEKFTRCLKLNKEW